MSKILKISAGVRYYEDADIDGVEDISYDEQQQGAMPRVPCVVMNPDEKNKADIWRWCPEIDAETGMVLNWKKGVKANIHYKVCDDCMIDYFEDEKLVCNNDDYWYCPDFLCPDEEGYGDYIIMTINEIGQIENWSVADVNKWVKGQKES